MEERIINATKELVGLLQMLSQKAAAESDGNSQQERADLANAATKAFLMGADIVGTKYRLSKAELDVAMLAAHSIASGPAKSN